VNTKEAELTYVLSLSGDWDGSNWEQARRRE